MRLDDSSMTLRMHAGHGNITAGGATARQGYSGQVQHLQCRLIIGSLQCLASRLLQASGALNALAGSRPSSVGGKENMDTDEAPAQRRAPAGLSTVQV